MCLYGNWTPCRNAYKDTFSGLAKTETSLELKKTINIRDKTASQLYVSYNFLKIQIISIFERD